jgi:hypothetical protein
MTSYIIEGVDNLGKGTLITNIIKHEGYKHYIHYEKPKKCLPYHDDLLAYQSESFNQGFKLLHSGIPVIYDRFHLGEVVYSERYRKYDGNYVFDAEINFWAERLSNVTLVLLTTSSFDFISDDGLSFDVTAREEEQKDFIKAFNRSIFPKKVLVDVHDGQGKFKEPLDIYREAVGLATIIR